MSQLPPPDLQPPSSRFDPANATKTCPACAESIKLEARVCRYCGHPFTDDEIQTLLAEAKQKWEESHQLTTFYSSPNVTVTSDYVVSTRGAFLLESIQPIQSIVECSRGNFAINLVDATGNPVESLISPKSDLAKLQTIAQAINNAINYRRVLPAGTSLIQVVMLNKTTGMGWCAWILVIAAAIVLAIIVMSFA